MSPPQRRATFTVFGANAAALDETARRQADALAGLGYDAEVTSLDIHANMRSGPGGEITGWRADVVVSLRPRPQGPDEEPF